MLPGKVLKAKQSEYKWGNSNILILTSAQKYQSKQEEIKQDSGADVDEIGAMDTSALDD